MLAHLSHRGCDLAHGYLLSRPVPRGTLEKWLAAERIGGADAPSGVAVTA